jgi:hypothetical protein
MENYTEDNIRSPDSIIREQLLEDDRSDFEKEIDNVIQLSYEELLNQNEAISKYENEIMEQYNISLLERKNKCDKILIDMNKIIKFDKEIKEIYEIIEPILELYYNQNINYCVFEEKTYNRIFNLISKIRTDKTNVDFLKTVIIKENNTSFKIIN